MMLMAALPPQRLPPKRNEISPGHSTHRTALAVFQYFNAINQFEVSLKNFFTGIAVRVRQPLISVCSHLSHHGSNS